MPDEVLSDNGGLLKGQFSYLKTGLSYADKITTVSQKYAEEIRSNKEYGIGMEDVLFRRKKDLSGILNGVDYSIWNPSLDKIITYDIRIRKFH